MPSSLKLTAYSDRELMAMIHDLGEDDPDNWVTSEDLARALGLDHPRPRQCCGARLSWLRRYGVVERHPIATHHAWRLTPVGEVLMKGKLNDREQAALERLGTEQMLLVTRWLGQRQGSVTREAGTLMSREWRYSTFRGVR